MLMQHLLHLITRKFWPMLLGIVIASFFLAGCAASKVYHVGILASAPDLDDAGTAFKTKMAALGYIEGQNINYDIQHSNNDPTLAQTITKQFVADKVDLIFAFASTSATAAKAATQGTTIPIVFAITTIEGTGLVATGAQPGGNITGVRYPLVEVTGKRLELLLQIAPGVKRLWVAYLADYPPALSALKLLRPAANAQGVTLVEVPVHNLDEIKADLQARAKAGDIGMDAMLLVPDALTPRPDSWAVLSAFASQHHIPIVGHLNVEVRQGALFVYNTENSTSGEEAAALADKIFKGHAVGTIPVVTPYVALRINYQVAQQLGLSVPEGLLKQADEVIR